MIAPPTVPAVACEVDVVGAGDETEDVPEKVDVVDIFRRADAVPGIVEEAIAMGAKVVWMQLGIVNEAAAKTARDAGLRVVMDRCMKIEYGRLSGELAWCGVNSGLISSRRRKLIG